MRDWLQIVSNIAVLAGLILVAVQINQNSSITEADLLSRGYESVLQYHTALIGEEGERVWVKAALTPAELTPAEVGIVRRSILFWVDIHGREEAMMKLGHWNSPAREEYLKIHARLTYGANPVARAFWERWSKNNPHWEFVRTVNEHLPPKGEWPERDQINYLINAANDA